MVKNSTVETDLKSGWATKRSILKETLVFYWERLPTLKKKIHYFLQSHSLFCVSNNLSAILYTNLLIPNITSTKTNNICVYHSLAEFRFSHASFIVISLNIGIKKLTTTGNENTRTINSSFQELSIDSSAISCSTIFSSIFLLILISKKFFRSNRS